ncbi:MAG: STAS domain-containing protein [Spirochaetes bacterium]|jgi:anti-anti-sigma factor|nr:STAS domain-containing protein [Spirochaetota bacterium]
MASLHYTREKRGNAVIVHIGGSLDAKTAPTLDKKLGDEAAMLPAKLIISMKKLEYIASAGMGTLINYNEILSKQGKKLILCDLPEKVAKIIKMLGFINFFTIHKTLDDAENE